MAIPKTQIRKIWKQLISKRANTFLDQNQVAILANILLETGNTTLGQRLVNGEATAVVAYLSNHKVIYVESKTGSRVPITLTKLLGGPNKKPETKVILALRNAIAEQIQNFRKNLDFPQFCYLSGQKLFKWSKMHIDHVYPFSKLVEDFLAQQKITLEQIKVTGRSARTYTLANPALLELWKDYHALNAVLAPVAPRANLQKGAKDGTKKYTESLNDQ